MWNKSVCADDKKARDEDAGLGMYDWFDASFFIVFMSTDKLVLFSTTFSVLGTGWCVVIQEATERSFGASFFSFPS
jgi:hypothetical protein